MFRRKPQSISDILGKAIRENGLETPLLQLRLIEAWDAVAGSVIAQYTQDKFIKNQTLFVEISSPAVRSEVNMLRTGLVKQLNAAVGSFVISDIRVF